VLLTTYTEFLSRRLMQYVLKDAKKLIVVDLEKEEIVQWLT
jgi:hypothetical protein